MKVALVGATGKAGSRILAELVQRGHQVTAMARHVEAVPAGKGVTARAVAADGSDLADAMRGHDAVISAARFVDLDPDILLPAVIASGVPRYVLVGGAGSLRHPDGTLEVEFIPEPFQPNSRRGGVLLDMLRQTEGLDWTFISPPRKFVPGERTGSYRVGKDEMLMKDGEPTSISFEDMAKAIVDEIEEPRHLRQRFTIGY